MSLELWLAFVAASAMLLLIPGLASPRAQRRFHVAGGSLPSLAGARALLAKRPA